MKPCASCGRDGDLRPRKSALNGHIYYCCPVCIEHDAEPLPAVVHTVNGSGWRGLPPGLRQSIRIFDLEEYVPIPVWAARLSHRQMTLVREKQEEREVLAAMKRKITLPQPPASPRSQRTWIQRLHLQARFGL